MLLFQPDVLPEVAKPIQVGESVTVPVTLRHWNRAVSLCDAFGMETDRCVLGIAFTEALGERTQASYGVAFAGQYDRAFSHDGSRYAGAFDRRPLGGRFPGDGFVTLTRTR